MTLFEKIEESLDGNPEANVGYIDLNTTKNNLISYKGIEIRVSEGNEENISYTLLNLPSSLL